MTKMLPLLFIVFTAVLLPEKPFAQIKQGSGNQTLQRCATDEAIQRRYLSDPAFRAMMDERERQYREAIASGVSPITGRSATLTGPVTIPVVIHVVLPNPWIITDNDVQYFINRLNLDFSGLNPDSTNCGTYCGIRGHSLLRFTLAKRTPAGGFTTGIERRTSNVQILGAEPQPIKITSAGGLDPWDVSQYYNLWVGIGGGLLGIAPEIGPGSATNDGVCINYQAFSNSCFAIGSFNQARTAVHEIGHNFGLYHNFQGGCVNNDFAQLTSAGCTLPPGLLAAIDDTPPQSISTSGCPAAGTLNGCTPNVPSMFQNFMDYTNDTCYSMFTNGQVQRMEWILENCRAGYLTTQGGQYPAGLPALDAQAIAIVAPGGSDLNAGNCTVVNYPMPTCTGIFIPRVRVTNAGTATITSITVTTTMNGASPVTQTIITNIATGRTVVLVLGPQIAVAGANLLTITLTLPNGGTDANPADNTISTSFTVSPPSTSPYTQDFVTTGFPPTGITVLNPDNSTTWVRNANGNLGAGSAFMDCYNYSLQDQSDDLAFTIGGLNPGDTAVLSFDVSHRPYSASPTSTFLDTLSVWHSFDCGTTTLFSGYKKWGATLGTVAASTAAYTTPTVWRRDTVMVRLTTGNLVRMMIRCTNRYGNNIFIDNINIDRRTARTYFFTGNGNWSDPANWTNNMVPPTTLPLGEHIIIDPVAGGECVLDVSMTITSAGSITVMAGKRFRIPGNLIIQ